MQKFFSAGGTSEKCKKIRCHLFMSRSVSMLTKFKSISRPSPFLYLLRVVLRRKLIFLLLGVLCTHAVYIFVGQVNINRKYSDIDL
jgi:hypothetical protein